MLYINGLACSKPAHGFGASIESHVQIGDLRYTLEFPALSQLEQKKRDDLIRVYLQGIHGDRPHISLSVPMTPALGQTSVESYTISSAIGSTSRTRFHVAVHVRTGRLYAYKRTVRQGRRISVIDDEINVLTRLKDALNGTRFIRTLEHVIDRKSNDVQHGQDVHLFFSPLVDMDLQDWIKNKRTLHTTVIDAQNDKVCLSIFAQCARGLQTLHNAGWVHRDIKPQNIGIRQQETGQPPLVCIIDLERAYHLTELEPAIRVERFACGTPTYIAPEMEIEGGTYGQAVDMFALGATGLDLFRKGPPWRAGFNP